MRLAALGFLLVLPAFGQAQKAEYSVNGTVRNGVTGEPVRNALVGLIKVPSDPFGAGAVGPQEKAMLSGPGGEFHFGGLPEGLYAIAAHKPGFIRDENIANSKTFVIPSPPAEAAIQIKLTPFGAIEGKVVSQYDEPLEKVVLEVYELRIHEGEKILNKAGTVWTDDRGLFHLAWIEPGNYLVKVAGMTGGTETHVGPYPTHYAPWEGFSPIYFGGATSVESAVPIPVAAGSYARADFRLEVQPIFKISGQVQGYEGPEAVNFELVRGDERATPSRALLDVTTGKFEVLDVTPGTYRLRAEQGQTRGEVTVNVGGADVNGISIALQPAPPIRGMMRSVGGRADALHEPNPCGLNLRARGHSDAVHVPSWQADSHFSLEGVFPGEYEVRFQCFGAYLQSVSFGATDLLANPILTIATGASPAIEVNYTPGGGSLQVRLVNPAPPDGAVLLVPTFSASVGPELKPANRFDTGQPSGDMYQFSNLAPGDYLIYVLPKSENAEFRNPAFLRTLSGGTSVHVEDGKTAEVAITGISK